MMRKAVATFLFVLFAFPSMLNAEWLSTYAVIVPEASRNTDFSVFISGEYAGYSAAYILITTSNIVNTPSVRFRIFMTDAAGNRVANTALIVHSHITTATTKIMVTGGLTVLPNVDVVEANTLPYAWEFECDENSTDTDFMTYKVEMWFLSNIK
jgi:hypothetical protein